jgi:dTDP-4-dehydrorhamnose reductase
MSARRKLLIVGTRGFVGGHLRSAAEGAFELCEDNGLDITDPTLVDAAVRAAKPESVVLLAAISDIDRCQRDPALAARVNSAGAAHVARACKRHGARLILTSTGAVFDGCKQGYYEQDELRPINIYGETKARAEMDVACILKQTVIARLPLVIGFAGRAGTNSLADKLLASFSAGRPVVAPNDEFRNPIDVATLCAFLLHFARCHELSGTFHIGASNCISRYELARRLARATGHSPELVTPEGARAPERAPRGQHLFLIPEKASGACGILPPSVDEAIERILHVPA